MLSIQSRRGFLDTLILDVRRWPDTWPGECRCPSGPPETTKIRIAKGLPLAGRPSTSLTHSCAPKALSKSSMRSRPAALTRHSRGEVDLSMHSPPSIAAIDAGEPITLLAGVHVGCFELFGHDGINSIRDLKGKKGQPGAWFLITL